MSEPTIRELAQQVFTTSTGEMLLERLKKEYLGTVTPPDFTDRTIWFNEGAKHIVILMESYANEKPTKVHKD